MLGSFVKKSLKVVGIVGVTAGGLAIYTKPSEEHFLLEISNQKLNPAEMLIAYNVLKTITVFDDYIFFKTATVRFDGKTATGIGAFGKWHYDE